MMTSQDTKPNHYRRQVQTHYYREKRYFNPKRSLESYINRLLLAIYPIAQCNQKTTNLAENET